MMPSNLSEDFRQRKYFFINIFSYFLDIVFDILHNENSQQKC